MALDKAVKHQWCRRDGEGLNFEGYCSEWANLSQGESLHFENKSAKSINS